MLEQVDLSRNLSKAKYKEALPLLQDRLHQLQRTCWKKRLATVLVFEGWDASGRVATIRKLTERLEPRGYDLHSTVAQRTVERQLPWLYRFWIKIPSYGRMAIFDRSWHSQLLADRFAATRKQRDCGQAYEDISSFERALTDDCYAIIKFFLHIDKREQRRRLKLLEREERNSWRLQDSDWTNHEAYNEHLAAFDEMLTRTDSSHAPWTIVEATDKRWTRVKVLSATIAHLEKSLRQHGSEVPAKSPQEPLDGDRERVSKG